MPQKIDRATARLPDAGRREAWLKREKPMRKKTLTVLLPLAVLIAAQVLTGGEAWAWGKKKIDNRKTVAVFTVKSHVPEVDPTPYTEFVTTTLVKSKAFKVLDRQKSVYAEKQLNQQGMTTGNAAGSLLLGADFIFVVTITEANAQADKTGVGGTYKGAGVESSGERAEIGLDISVQDAKTAEVLDAVHVSKKVSQSGFSATGLGNLLSKTKLKGTNLGIARDKKEGVDKAIQACIEDAVSQIVANYEE
jgi:curli biogenesis system outer membrane secretion channel CsgG